MHYRLRDISPSGSFLVSTFALHTYDQINLLYLTLNNVSIEDAACQWVRNNSVTWSNWILPLPNLVAYVDWNSPVGIIAVVLSVIVLILILTSLVVMIVYRDHTNIKGLGFYIGFVDFDRCYVYGSCSTWTYWLCYVTWLWTCYFFIWDWVFFDVGSRFIERIPHLSNLQTNQKTKKKIVKVILI